MTYCRYDTKITSLNRKMTKKVEMDKISQKGLVELTTIACVFYKNHNGVDVFFQSSI